MPDLVDQHVSHDITEGFLVLCPIIQHRTTVYGNAIGLLASL